MNLSLESLAPVGIIALGGLILIWWLTRRLPGVLRVLLRVVAIPALLVAVGFVVITMNRSTSFAVPETETIIVPSERLTTQNGTLTVTLNATGSLTAADEETLAFDLAAPITDVSVAVGDTVKAGDVLAQVDTASIDTQIQNAQFSLMEAQNSLTALNAPATDIEIKIAEAQVQAATASLSSALLSGASEQDIEIARLNVELAKNSLWQAQVNRDASESRPGAGYEINAYANDIEQANQLANSDNNVTTAGLNYQSTVNDGPDAASLASGNASLMSAQANLDSLLAGPSTTDVRQAEIKVETAQLSLDAAQQSLEQATLVAPFDGVVAAGNLVEGTMPSTGSITLVNTGGYNITLSVDEKDITQLAVGQSVSLEVSALAGASLSGHVTHIDPAPVSSESGQLVTYNIEVTLDASNEPLRPGMSAIATVTLNQIDDVIVVPNRFITVDAVTQAATVKVETAAGEYEDIPVTLGTRTDSESEVVSGLNIGQTLVILPTASEASAAQGGFGLLPGGGVPGAGGGFPGGGGGPPAGFTGGGGGGRPGG